MPFGDTNLLIRKGISGSIYFQLSYHTANLQTREKLLQVRNTLLMESEILKRKTFSFFARSSNLEGK
jgi:hypothetical protein